MDNRRSPEKKDEMINRIKKNSKKLGKPRRMVEKEIDDRNPTKSTEEPPQTEEKRETIRPRTNKPKPPDSDAPAS